MLCLAWSAPAAAGEFVPAITLQTGSTVTRGRGLNADGYFASATPSLQYFLEGDRKLLNFTYAATGSIDTVLPNAISNRLAIETAFEITPVTRLLFGVEGVQALLGNNLLVRTQSVGALGAGPALNTSLLTITASQGVQTEFTPRLKFTQLATAVKVTSLDEAVPLDNTLATASFALNRAFTFNSFGALLEFQYARTNFPPINTQIFTVAAGPTWDHDFTPNLTMSLGVQGQVVASADTSLKPQFGPAGNAAISYGNLVSGISLDYNGGIEPNLLVGALLQTNQVTLRAFTPLSERHKVIVGTAAGYLNAKQVDLNETGTLDGSFSAVLHDAEIIWQAADFLTFSLRYQFLGQTAGQGQLPTPALVRHATVFGIEFFSSRGGSKPRKAPTRFSGRSDGIDPTQPSTGAFSSGASSGSSSSYGGGGGGP